MREIIYSKVLLDNFFLADSTVFSILMSLCQWPTPQARGRSGLSSLYCHQNCHKMAAACSLPYVVVTPPPPLLGPVSLT
jgi:hypothetical protein